jgi:hypothetical protein
MYVTFEGPWLLLGVPLMVATTVLWIWAIIDAGRAQRWGWLLGIVFFHVFAAVPGLFGRSGGSTAAARLQRDVGRTPRGPWD